MKLKIFMIILILVTWFPINGIAKVNLRVGYVPLLNQLPLVVAYENDRQNYKTIDVNLIKYNSFTALEAAIRVGAIDFASLPVPILLSIATDGHKVKIIGSCHQGGSRIVTRESRNLTDIRGSIVGVPGLDSNENIILDLVLNQNGLRQGLDYKSIGVTFTTVLNDLKTKKIDVLFLPEPFGAMAEAQNIAVEVSGQEDQRFNLPGTVMVVRHKLLQKSKRAMMEWMVSINRSCINIEKDIQDSRGRQTSIIQKGYFDFSQNIVSSALKDRKGKIQFKMSMIKEEVIKEFMDTIIKLKMLDKSVDIKSLIDFDLMKRLK